VNEKLNILSNNKRMFVLEFLKTFKPGKAAEAVGLVAGTGSGYLGETDVQEAIAEQMELRTVNTQIDSDWVLVQLAKMFGADLADIFHPGTNDLRPVHEWPEIWRKMTTGVKITTLYEGKGDEKIEIGHTKDVKILDRLACLRDIGKHTDVRAFTERIEITTDQALTDRLMAGRKRARQRNKTVPNFM
jgi:phage terminase small subunit